jgi:hypothetical protein
LTVVQHVLIAELEADAQASGNRTASSASALSTSFRSTRAFALQDNPKSRRINSSHNSIKRSCATPHRQRVVLEHDLFQRFGNRASGRMLHLVETFSTLRVRYAVPVHDLRQSGSTNSGTGNRAR